ncbi:ribosome biogenesis GTPase Der [Geminicoccus flavidas]|uniref:ribosome biogenesis GTPase Der n=1 Tax=Geminicoccus flavidas TaxID=2506407 RepID=UPI001357D95C|nr:ribosome biogenesis GTPase Der [Geminicoccus flavidas]
MFTIAILGRPNVGKSTLFNRLVGRRQAIVHDQPGVTRDRLEGQGRIGHLRFRVIDTAGLDVGPDDSLEGRLRAQTLAGLEEADLGLFLFDARAGLTPLDHEVARLLQRTKKPIVVLANKCEGRQAEIDAAEAWSLGLGEPLLISAEHGDGMADLFQVIQARLPEEADEEEQDDAAPALSEPAELPAESAAGPELGAGKPVKLVVIGRPNVGKSSLINRLVGDERMLTGPEPGLTRDSVALPVTLQGRSFELIDTAGLRRKARIEQRLERISVSATVQALKFAHAAVLVVDATQPLEVQDLTIADLVLREGRALVVAINKWDLVETPKETLQAIRERLEDKLAQAPGLETVPISARTGQGVSKLLPTVLKTVQRWNRRITTAKLNRWLQDALAEHQPPQVGGRRLKIRFITQTASRPPTFVLFQNLDPADVPDHYLRYLANSLRRALDLPGVPLRLHARRGENPYARD